MEQTPHTLPIPNAEPEFAALVAIDWANQKHYARPAPSASSAANWRTPRKQCKPGSYS